MRHLLNTLFVTVGGRVPSLDGENVVANRGDEIAARYPLHTLQSIVSFSYAGASPGADGGPAPRAGRARVLQPAREISRPGLRPVAGECPAAADAVPRGGRPRQSCRAARMMIFGKVYNARWSVERTKRDTRCGWTPGA